MLNVRIGHTLLTWDVFANPSNIERGIRDIADLGFAGTETGGSLYDWWEQNRPGDLKRILGDAGIPMVTLFQFGEWTDPEAGPAAAVTPPAAVPAAPAPAPARAVVPAAPRPLAGDDPLDLPQPGD